MTPTDPPTPEEQEPLEPQPESRRPRRSPLSNIQILLIPVLIFGGMLVLDFRQRVVEGQAMVEEAASLERTIAEMEAEQRRLEAAKVYYSSEAYIEDWARSQGKMVQPGEVLIVPMLPEADVAAAPQPPAEAPPSTPAQTNPEIAAPWVVWWSLFFDEPPPLGE